MAFYGRHVSFTYVQFDKHTWYTSVWHSTR